MLLAGCSATPVTDPTSSPSPSSDTPELIEYRPGAPASSPLAEGVACGELYGAGMEGLGADVAVLVNRVVEDSVSDADVVEFKDAFEDLLYVRNMAPASLALHLDHVLMALSDVHDAKLTSGGTVKMDEYSDHMKEVISICGSHLLAGTLG